MGPWVCILKRLEAHLPFLLPLLYTAMHNVDVGCLCTMLRLSSRLSSYAVVSIGLVTRYKVVPNIMQAIYFCRMEVLLTSCMMLLSMCTHKNTLVENIPMKDSLLMKDGQNFGQEVATALMEIPQPTTAMRAM